MASVSHFAHELCTNSLHFLRTWKIHLSGNYIQNSIYISKRFSSRNSASIASQKPLKTSLETSDSDGGADDSKRMLTKILIR